MATHKGEDRMPVQGGFLVLKPHLEDFKAIIRTLMTTEFFQGSAWGGSKIGWFWGGMTVQVSLSLSLGIFFSILVLSFLCVVVH